MESPAEPGCDRPSVPASMAMEVNHGADTDEPVDVLEVRHQPPGMEGQRGRGREEGRRHVLLRRVRAGQRLYVSVALMRFRTILAAGMSFALASNVALAQTRETPGATHGDAADSDSERNHREGDGTDQRPEHGRLPDPRAGSGADSGGKGTGSASDVQVPGKGAPAPEVR